ncbi:MAG: hypothetical protein AB7V19_07480 [Candidatus Bipolaricaulia bacterium]
MKRSLVPVLLLILFPLFALAQEAPLFEIRGGTTLNWIAPTQNVDGTPLTDLAGYRIYYGKTSGLYDGNLEVPVSSATSSPVSLTLESELDDFWYFAMTAYDTDGNESAYSNEVGKRLQVVVIDNRPPAPPVLQSVDMQLECLGLISGITCTITITDVSP